MDRWTFEELIAIREQLNTLAKALRQHIEKEEGGEKKEEEDPFRDTAEQERYKNEEELPIEPEQDDQND